MYKDYLWHCFIFKWAVVLWRHVKLGQKFIHHKHSSSWIFGSSCTCVSKLAVIFSIHLHQNEVIWWLVHATNLSREGDRPLWECLESGQEFRWWKMWCQSPTIYELIAWCWSRQYCTRRGYWWSSLSWCNTTTTYWYPTTTTKTISCQCCKWIQLIQPHKCDTTHCS